MLALVREEHFKTTPGSSQLVQATNGVVYDKTYENSTMIDIASSVAIW